MALSNNHFLADKLLLNQNANWIKLESFCVNHQMKKMIKRPKFRRAEQQDDNCFFLRIWFVDIDNLTIPFRLTLLSMTANAPRSYLHKTRLRCPCHLKDRLYHSLTFIFINREVL